MQVIIDEALAAVFVNGLDFHLTLVLLEESHLPTHFIRHVGSLDESSDHSKFAFVGDRQRLRDAQRRQREQLLRPHAQPSKAIVFVVRKAPPVRAGDEHAEDIAVGEDIDGHVVVDGGELEEKRTGSVVRLTATGDQTRATVSLQETVVEQMLNELDGDSRRLNVG